MLDANLLLDAEIARMPASLRLLAMLSLHSAADGYTGLQTARTSYHWNDGLRDTIVDAWISYSTPRQDADHELVRPAIDVFDSVLHDLLASDPSLRDGGSGVFPIPTIAGISNAKLSLDLSELTVNLIFDVSLTKQVASDTLPHFVSKLPL